MIPFDQRLNIGQQILERLRAKRSTAHMAYPESGRKPAAQGQSGSASFFTGSQLAGSLGWKRSNAAARAEAPVLEAVLEQTGELAPFSALLGLCEDGLPCLLDLTNPAPGSLLVVGDAQSGKTHLIQSLLASVTRLNTAEQVSYHLVVRNPLEFQSQALARHCRDILPSGDPQIPGLLLDLSREVQARRRNGVQKAAERPAVMLCIDDLAGMLQGLDADGVARLHWLAKHGPRSRVWIIASLSSENAPDLNPRLLDAFRTHLVCGITNRRLAKYLCGDTRLNTRDVDFGNQFFVPYGDRWLRSWICKAQEAAAKEVEA